jgi:HK97 family phage major capsid protein
MPQTQTISNKPTGDAASEIRSLRGSSQTRQYTITRESLNEDDRTVEIAFSSDTPVDRYFYTEILDHSLGAARLDRLNSGAPLLVEHDRSQQVGVVVEGSATIDADGKGRARVRFARTALAEDEFGMVRDGIRTKVSVGYLVHDFEEIRGADGEKPIVRITSWEAFENSLVSLPADESVGVGRNFNLSEIKQMQEAIQTAAPTDAADNTQLRSADQVIDIQAEREQAATNAVNNANQRAKKIIDAANIYPNNAELRQLADTCVVDGTSSEDFMAPAMPLIGKKQDAITSDDPATNIGLSRAEVNNFSILRAVRAIADQSAGGAHWSKAAPFEHECTRHIEDQLGRESNGLFVPYDVQRSGGWIAPGMPGYRAVPMDVSENSDLVATDHLAGSFIEALRAEAVVMMMGGRMLSGLVGNVDIPRNDTPATFTWLAEDGSSVDAEIATGTLSLTPKTISGSVPITRRLRKQSSPDAEALVRSDLLLGAALGIDLGALSGTGASNQPTGVSVVSGTSTSTIASAGSPTWAELVEFETDVAAANGLRGSLAMVTTAAVRGNLKTTSKDTGSGQFLMANGEANGYPVHVSTQLAANTILFGNWNEVLIGMWGVLDIRVDTATEAAKDRVTLRAFQDVDIGVRHAASFCKNA